MNKFLKRHKLKKNQIQEETENIASNMTLHLIHDKIFPQRELHERWHPH